MQPRQMNLAKDDVCLLQGFCRFMQGEHRKGRESVGITFWIFITCFSGSCRRASSYDLGLDIGFQQHISFFAQQARGGLLNGASLPRVASAAPCFASTMIHSFASKSIVPFFLGYPSIFTFHLKLRRFCVFCID